MATRDASAMTGTWALPCSEAHSLILQIFNVISAEDSRKKKRLSACCGHVWGLAFRQNVTKKIRRGDGTKLRIDVAVCFDRGGGQLQEAAHNVGFHICMVLSHKA